MEGDDDGGSKGEGEKYWGKKNRFPWPHLKPHWLRVCLIFHNQSGLANPGLPHLLKGVFCCVFKVTETFQVSPCLPPSCFFFIPPPTPPPSVGSSCRKFFLFARPCAPVSKTLQVGPAA